MEYQNQLSSVPRAEGAPQYYARANQIYRQNVDGEGELIDNDEEHLDYGGSQALVKVNGLQLGANKKVKSTKNKKK